MRPQLALARHRATTAHLCSAYPFAAELGLRIGGVRRAPAPAGGGGLRVWSVRGVRPRFVATIEHALRWQRGVRQVTATAKTFIHRSVGVFGTLGRHRRPEGRVPAVGPGARTGRGLATPWRLATVQPRPRPATHVDAAEQVRRQSEMLVALLGSVLKRDLAPVEDAVLGGALRVLASSGVAQPTLADVAHLTAAPTAGMVPTTTADADLAKANGVDPLLGKLLDRRPLSRHVRRPNQCRHRLARPRHNA